MFRALVLDGDGGMMEPSVQEMEEGRLPEGDVLVEVHYSSLNYKDALAVTGRGKIVRGSYPFVPGIDLVGRVVSSESRDVAPGDFVIGTGWGIGEDRWGGYSELQRVRSEWLVPLPPEWEPKDAMVAGTAGLTAMLSLMALEDHGVVPARGQVVVTGASGGVGSMSVALLANRGYSVVASTGSTEAHAYLRELGAERIIDREVLGWGAERPLDSARWAGGVDTVGGATLGAILTQLDRHGSVAACGLAGGSDLNTTVFPFILRGVNLLGIDSNTCPQPLRRQAWRRLAADLDAELLRRINAAEIALAGVPRLSEELLDGGINGRVIVDVRS